MDMSIELLTKLRNAYPFIYKVSDNYFFMGLSIFRPCTEEEIELFKKFQKSYSQVMEIVKNDFENRKYEITFNDAKELVEIFEKITNSVKPAPGELEAFLIGCTKTEIYELDMQYTNMTNTLYLKNKMDGTKFNKNVW